MATETRTHDDYTVGWVCALPKEQAAAIAMLDQRHPDLFRPPNDCNTYILGSIGKHNIVIACLPAGKISTNAAATVAIQMINTFPSIKFGLIVGIGGGIPHKGKIRLGDVVVSVPSDQYPGVVQWDSGKAEHAGKFKRTGALNNPPTVLLTALSKVAAYYELEGSKIPGYLDEMKQKYPRLETKYLKSDSLEDVLFKANYHHCDESRSRKHASLECSDGDKEEEEEEYSCQYCDKAKVVKRKPRNMRVHYGLIASGNQVIEDSSFREKLNRDLGGTVLCVETGAAGLMDNFPCIVIRGIWCYADSHKNTLRP
ncbi:nucleoside phosphorylase domain-containing protein [Biscogniauxia marginata]|nr:nucleoside phosphorylase domain-containing protein [Biscogniauxia marginata]